MAVIAIILLTIVLVAQIVLFILYFLEKRYVNHRFSAMLQYIDRKVEDADCREEIEESVDDILDAFGEKINERFKQQDEVNAERFKRHHDAIIETRNAVSEQVNGLLLDYTQAQEAANKVNDFASGLSSIFDYDPMEAIRRNRNKEAR
jgi:predicted Holliday junction resolvase-like endonuclease